LADVVNLRARRKEAARKAAQVQADANSARFGRTKADRTAQTARNAKDVRKLDGHKLVD